jgi:hypothetical protein
MLQAGRSRVRVQIGWIFFFQFLISDSYLIADFVVQFSCSATSQLDINQKRLVCIFLGK